MRAKRKVALLGAAALAAAALSGCGTVVNLALGVDAGFYVAGEIGGPHLQTRITGGVQVDAQAVRKGWEWQTPDPDWMRIFPFLFIFDFPLSLAADTLTLPITIPIELFRDRKK